MPDRRENCFKFLAGVCERGDSCKFYHDKQAARYIKKNVPGGRAAAARDFGITVKAVVASVVGVGAVAVITVIGKPNVGIDEIDIETCKTEK